MDIRTLDIADDALMREVYEVQRRAELVGREHMPFWGFEEFLGSIRSPDPGEHVERFGAWDQERLVGTGVVYSFLLDNTDKSYLCARVDPEARHRGVGRALVSVLEGRALADGRTTLLADAKVPFEQREDHPSRRFAESCGYEVANVEVVRHLELPVEDQLIQSWLDHAAQRHQGYLLQTFVDDVPADLVEPLCVLLGQLAADAPSGSVDFEAEVVTVERFESMRAAAKAMGRTVLETVALTPDRQLVAQSTLAIPTGSGTEAWQWGTYVHREHRGHRLGLATKAQNLRAAQQANPALRLVTTQNGETNDHMVAINETVGFQPVEVDMEFVRRV